MLDEAKWGTPSPQQVVARNWDWKITDEQWREAVKQKGEGQREEVKFDLWLPEGLPVVKGIVVMSGHGSGETSVSPCRPARDREGPAPRVVQVRRQSRAARLLAEEPAF